MTFYKIYDRTNLKMVDSGVVRDYQIDLDYLTNNSSTLDITETSQGFKGDILAISEGVNLIVLGVITAIDNTDLKISFRHMKELFNDNVLNVFRSLGTLNATFDAVQGLRILIEFAFVNTTDPMRRLPLDIRAFGTSPGAVWVEDSLAINLQEFIDWSFDHYNVYLDFDLDFLNNRIVVTIRKNEFVGHILKDNIKLSKPEVDNNELPRENRAILVSKDTRAAVATYFLRQDNTITNNPNDPMRLMPPATKIVEWDEVDAIREGYTREDLARSELEGNIYNHCILYKLAKRQTMVRPDRFNYGDKVTIIYENREYESIFTGLRFRKNDPFVTCIFGKTRIDFTDRMKLYNQRRYARKI